MQERDMLTWPDGSWCFRSEVHDGIERDQCRVIQYQSEEWRQLYSRDVVPLPPAISPDGAMVPPEGAIVDAQLAVWCLANDVAPGGRSILKKGTQFAGGSGELLLWKSGKIYTRSILKDWYQATDNSWIKVDDPTASLPAAALQLPMPARRKHGHGLRAKKSERANRKGTIKDVQERRVGPEWETPSLEHPRSR